MVYPYTYDMYIYLYIHVSLYRCHISGFNGYDADAAATQSDLAWGAFGLERGGRDMVLWDGFARDLRAHFGKDIVYLLCNFP